MCGIVGILGNHEVGPLLVNALKRLEYRGYDSAGIATLNDGKLGRRRSLGKLAELSDLLVRDPIQGKSGIGHTRWAQRVCPMPDFPCIGSRTKRSLNSANLPSDLRRPSFPSLRVAIPALSYPLYSSLFRALTNNGPTS